MIKYMPLLALAGCTWLFSIPPDLLEDDNGPIQATIPVTIQFDEKFPKSDIPVVLAAASYWNKISGVRLFTDELSVDGELLIVTASVENPTDKNAIQTNNKHPHIIASTHTGRIEKARVKDAVITFYEAWLFFVTGADQESAARHELGHVLGLDHTTDPNCVMHASVIHDDTPRELCASERDLIRKMYVLIRDKSK